MIAAFSVAPVGPQHVGDAVAECVRVVRDSGLPNETNAMFTNIEGEWDDIQRVLKQCMDVCEKYGPRVSLVVKIDHHPGAGHEHSIRYKKERVEQALAEGE
jgi:uncharacterized protein YqgV (UPF0045/DUF77 family)